MSTWNPRFETGHPNIDAEHQEFFRRLDSVRTAIDAGEGRERIIDMITILQQYTLGHFSREEAHMRRVNCPALVANCTEHQEFAHRLDAWLTLLSTGVEPISLLVDIHREATAWIESHIVNIDCQLRNCRQPDTRPPIA
jgi:hemerythrin